MVKKYADYSIKIIYRVNLFSFCNYSEVFYLIRLLFQSKNYAELK